MGETIFGLDIMPHSSPGSKREPRYALVIVRDGKVAGEHLDVPLRRLIRFVWEHRPSKIGIDNVFELGRSEREVARILSLLPPETSIVQVTMTEEGALSIRSVAKAYGIEVHGKPDPLKTAYLAAYLAERGAGYSVRAFEDKTQIYVVRGRRHSRGGSSQDRFQRMSRGMVLRVAKKIKSTLEKAGIDFDMTVRKSEGGLERCVFTVYAPREKLKGLIKPYRSRGVRVVVRPVYKGELTFRPVASKDTIQPVRKLIVGVDPGTVTGVAIIDTYGNLHLLSSRRNLDRQEIISMILEVGKPVVIASDVNPPPDSVVKLAQSLKAELYVPPQSLSTAEKQGLVEKYVSRVGGLKVEDTHQRDALSAAIKALNHYQSKLRQAEAYVGRLDLDINVDAVREAVIRGRSVAEAVEEEISKLLTVEAGEVEEKAAEKTQPHTVNVERYIKRIRELERENILLKERVRGLREELKSLRMELELARKEEHKEARALRELSTLADEVKRLSGVVRGLQDEIYSYKSKAKSLKDALIMLGRGEVKLARSMTSITVDSLLKSKRIYGESLKDEVLHVESLAFAQDEALSIMRREGVLGVIADSAVREVKERIEREYQIPVVETADLEGVIRIDDLVLYSRGVESELRTRRDKLIRIYEESKRIDLDLLLEEYRRERWRSRSWD